MKNVDIEIFCIAQTRMNQDGMRQWLNRCGASETPVLYQKDWDNLGGRPPPVFARTVSNFLEPVGDGG